MSTRSGKRIHVSFHKNTVKSDTEITRSERKTRSKHTNENVDTYVSPTVKKRNYVMYPTDDEVETVDSKSKDGERTTRALRKNALKERNVVSSTETVGPSVDTRKSMRSTRRTRKFDENAQDIPEDIPQVEEPTKVEQHPKPKKGKKKKAEQEVKVDKSKKRTKKKKVRKSDSMIVEHINVETPSGLNKSYMSMDSFHSTVGSPLDMEACDEPAPQVDFDPVSTENIDTNNMEVRKTRSSTKVNNISTENMSEKEWRKRSSVKLNFGSDDDTVKKENNNYKSPNRELRKRKSGIKDVTASEDTKDDKTLTFEMEKSNISARRSLRSATFDKTPTPIKISKEFEKDDGTCQENKTMLITSETNITDFKPSVEEIENMALEKDSVNRSGCKSKKRKSAVKPSIKVTEKPSPFKTSNGDRRKSVEKASEKDLENVTCDKMNSNASLIGNSSYKASPMKTIEKCNRESSANNTFEINSETDSESIQGKKKSIIDMTFDITSSPFKSANEVSFPENIVENDLKEKSVINTTYEKDSDIEELKNGIPDNTFDKDVKINTTFEKDANETNDIKNKRKSVLRLSTQKMTDTEINSTFDVGQNKLNTTFDKNSKSSIISSDNSMITLDKSDTSRISMTSDESKNEENILNATPVLIESSIDETVMNITKTPTKEDTNVETVPITPLKREGTFTKEEPEVMESPRPKTSLSRTPTKQMSLPSPGFTPFHVNKSSSKEKSMMNVTRSIEKRRSSLAEPSRITRVMFCSPVNNPALVTQNRRKVIKSNLKGSNKSFVFDESVSLGTRPANRKRSNTQSDADDARAKRKRLAEDMQQSVERLSRPRTLSASAKLAEPTTPSKKPVTPRKSEAKLPRTKLPNFAAMHRKQFDKMESLDECQERRARRARHLRTPTGAVHMLDRISPKDKAAESEKPKESQEIKEALKKPETPIKSLPTFKSLNPGYTRFGFKLNLDVNPFSIPSKAQPKPKENRPNGLTRQPTLPSLTGATSVRREIAKQTVMREKSFADRRNVTRMENRTVIKGVRTNRRFELQMRMRDM